MSHKSIVGCGSVLMSALFAAGAGAQEQPPAAEASASASLGGDSNASADASAPESGDDAKFEPEPMQFELGIAAGVMIPADDHNLRSDNAVQHEYTVAPEVALRASFLPVKYLGAEVEGAWAFTTTDDDDMANLFAARAHGILQVPIGRVTPFVVVGGGALGAGSGTMGTDTDPALHFGLGAKFMFSRGIGLRLDLRDTMHQKFDAEQDVLTHSPEALLSLAFALHLRHEKEKVPLPPPDSDGDGILDKADKCPKQAGIAPDGCPDKDTDGDTVMDSKDACPAEAGPPASCGCVPKDGDKDGVPDDYDKCPTEAGTINGCPDLDPDHDGVNVPNDKCPDKAETKNGFDDDDGCPDEIPEKIKKFTGVIKGIEFDTGKDTIRKVSEPVLENALLVLNEYPKTRIEISGHSDTTGTRDFNLDLSKRRADSVKAWFVGKGVDEKRIETRGAGPDEPIADNKTNAGRQKNRRIEFKLLQ
jgi:OOP family OmpA-OmpF porin